MISSFLNEVSVSIKIGFNDIFGFHLKLLNLLELNLFLEVRLGLVLSQMILPFKLNKLAMFGPRDFLYHSPH